MMERKKGTTMEELIFILHDNGVPDCEISNFLEMSIKHVEEEETEDTTRYGEFVTSYFAWVPMSKQKENVKRLENITKKREK